MKTLPRIDDFSELRRQSATIALLANGVIKTSKNDVELLTPYWTKKNVAARMVLYAIIDLYESGERHVYHAMLKDYIESPDTRDRILARMYYRVQEDQYEKERRKMTGNEICMRVDERALKLYQSNIQSALRALGNVFFRTTRKRVSNGHYAHFVILTASGRALRDALRKGYVF